MAITSQRRRQTVDENEMDDLDLTEDAETLDLGPCCRCGAQNGTVRSLLQLNRRNPYVGEDGVGGWGCVQCGIPTAGAVAPVCDECLPVIRAGGDFVDNLKFFAGATIVERVSIDLLPEGCFEHNPWGHPELPAPRTLQEFIPKGWHDAADVCSSCGVRYQARVVADDHGFGSVEWRAGHKVECEYAGDEGEGFAGWELSSVYYAIGDDERGFPAYLKMAEVLMCLQCTRLIVDVPILLFSEHLAWAFCTHCFPGLNVRLRTGRRTPV